MSGKPLWLDEAHSVLVASRPLSDISRYLAEQDCHPPLYYFLLHWWIQIFGIDERSTHGLSFVFYCLGLWATYALARQYLTSKESLFCVCFAACCPLALGHAENVRMYSLLELLASLSVLSFLRLNTLVGCIAFAILTLAGLLTHYWFAFVLVSEGALLLLFYRGRIRPFFWASLASGIGFLMLWGKAFFHHLSTPAAGYIAGMATESAWHGFLEIYGGNKAIIIFIAAAALGLWGTLRPSRAESSWTPPRFRAFRDGVVLTAVALIIPALISLKKPIFVVKALIIVVPALSLTLGALIATAPSQLIQLAFCFVLLAATAFKVVTRTAPNDENDRTAMQAIVSIANPNDRIVATGMSYASAVYYARLLRLQESVRVDGFPREIEVHSGWRSPEALLGTPDILRHDAEEIVSDLSKGGRFFVLYGFDREISQTLISELESHSRLTATLSLPGATHKEIRIYSKE